MQSQTILIVVIVAIVIIVLVVIGLMVGRGGRRAGFEPHALPPEELEDREQRIDEIERMFVNQPRDAVAAARLLVDEMLTRMGYPVRLTSNERARDLAHFNRAHADRIRTAGAIRDDANTEEMRRALKGYLDTARDILGEARARSGGQKPAFVPQQPETSAQRPGVAEERRTVVEGRPAAPRGPSAGRGASRQGLRFSPDGRPAPDSKLSIDGGAKGGGGLRDRRVEGHRRRHGSRLRAQKSPSGAVRQAAGPP